MPWSNGDIATAATAVIALAALLRPEIGRLFKRWRAMIDMHPAGRLEVGFSSFGPTIGVQGTLRAIGGDQFITFGKVTVERISDHLRHEFDWAIFRPQSIFTTQQQQTIEIAAAFSLDEAAPRRFNIQFHDSTTADGFRQPLGDLQRLWTEYFQAQHFVPGNIPANQMREIYRAFSDANLANITPLFQQIERRFYWMQGAYRMKLELITSRPARKFAFNYDFDLSEAESQSLRLNVVACFMATCNMPDVIFNFASPQYRAA